MRFGRPSMDVFGFFDQLEVVDNLYLFVCFAHACSLHTVISTENLLIMIKNDQEIKGT